MAASGQRREGAVGQHLATNDAGFSATLAGQIVELPPTIARIIDAWPGLPSHVREAIMLLVDSARSAKLDGSSLL
jgi:hypothetical protein